MKKCLALILSFLLMISGVSSVFANSASKDVNEILELIKPRIPSTDMFDKFSSSVNVRGGGTVYRFSWSVNDNKNDRYTSLEVGANGEGVIVSYNFYDELPYQLNNKASVNKIPSDEIMKVADDMLKKLNPSVSDNLKLSKSNKTESLYANSYTFDVQRYENSVPVLGDNGRITVSADAKTLMSFNIQYTEGLAVNSNEKFADKDDAVQSFYKNFGMKLKYYDSYKDGEKNIMLKYEPEMSYDEYINAVDLSVVKRKTSEEYRFAADESTNALKESASGGSSLTEIEEKEIKELGKLISVDDAEKISRQNKIINLDADFILDRHNLYREDERFVYSLRFVKAGESTEVVNVSIDAFDGTVISFYKNSSTYSEKKLTDDAVLEKANEAVKILAPKHFAENPEFLPDEENLKNGRVVYKRCVNGIEYENDSVNIAVNLSDGSIDSYYLDFNDEIFPSANSVISIDDAIKKLFEQIEYSVWYLPVFGDDLKYRAVPVFASKDNNFTLDALDGKLLYNFSEDAIDDYTDIDAHYAKEAINTLAKFGVGFDGGKFSPDEYIKQKDFVALLSAAFTTRHPIIIKAGFDYVSQYLAARNNGFITEDEFAPENEISRMDAAVMLIRAIGVEEAAKLESIYISAFDDVTSNRGYVAILNAMGVVSGDEYGKFNPNNKLTRADAALMLYNYLSK